MWHFIMKQNDKHIRESSCDNRMWTANKVMQTCTKHIPHTGVIDASIGVQQGFSQSWILFIVYIDRLVRLLQNNCSLWGSECIEYLHVMADTVILRKFRKMSIRKLRVLCNYCSNCRMIIKELKTNSDTGDWKDLKVL